MTLGLIFANSRGSDWGNFIVSMVSWVAFIALIVTGIVLRVCAKENRRGYAVRFLIFWTMVPPLWFWIEYHWIWKPIPSFQQSFERFVHSQECSRDIWLGIVGLLAALYVGSAPPPTEEVK